MAYLNIICPICSKFIRKITADIDGCKKCGAFHIDGVFHQIIGEKIVKIEDETFWSMPFNLNGRKYRLDNSVFVESGGIKIELTQEDNSPSFLGPDKKATL